MPIGKKFVLLDVKGFYTYLLRSSFIRIVRFIQNHHTFIPNYSYFNGRNHSDLLRAMERDHIRRGFAEIAQNITIFPDGSVALCRNFDRIPAGIKGANVDALCIENLGNFDLGADQMTREHIESAIIVNALLCLKYNLTATTNSLIYHHWYDLNTGIRTNGSGVTKSCPGTAFFGGNTVSDSHSNFLPLVISKMSQFSFPEKNVVNNNNLPCGVVESEFPVKVHKTPDKRSKEVRNIAPGIQVAIYQFSKKWFKIHRNGYWVHSSQINLINPSDNVCLRKVKRRKKASFEIDDLK